MTGGIGGIIALIFIVIWVVRIVASVAGNDGSGSGGKRSSKRGRSLQEWEQIQAQRRSEYIQSEPREQPQQTRIDASQMTMAQRIELARQRAAQQQSTQDSAEALHRARARAEAEARQKRQMQAQAQRQQSQREQAERQRAEYERRKRAEARRQAEKRAQAERLEQERARRRSRSSRKRPQKPTGAPKKADPSHVREDSLERVHKGHGHMGSVAAKVGRRRKGVGIKLGPFDAVSLRKAFIMKELLDKPVALRSASEDLLA